MATRPSATKSTTRQPIAPAEKAGILSRIGRRRQVVIPKEVFDALELCEGDLLEVKAVAGQVSMKRKRTRLADPEVTLSPGEAAKLRHSMKKVREGKVTPWATVKDELGL